MIDEQIKELKRVVGSLEDLRSYYAGEHPYDRVKSDTDATVTYVEGALKLIIDTVKTVGREHLMGQFLSEHSYDHPDSIAIKEAFNGS